MANKDTGSAMGVGGGGGIFSRKTELVADLTTAFKTLNAELEKTKRLSEEISKNLKGARPGSGGGSNLLGSSFGPSTGTQDANTTTDNSGGGGPSTASRVMGFLGRNALKLGAIGIQSLPTVEQAFEQDLLRSRFGFYGGRNANATQMNMARQGTTTDPMDAARASMTGASMGLMPGLKNFSSVAQSAAGISNLMPGVGLQGGMQAMGALNQGKNVNMLKMIGVNVRDAQGMMRGFDDIAKDLWKTLNSQKTGSKKISKEDISYSLQPGNALDSMMNQYFGNDPILRQSVISKLMDLAGTGGQGSSLDKTRLEKAGATTGAVTSMSDRNAASLNATQAVAPSVLKGFEKANEHLAAASNKLAEVARSAGILGEALRKALELKGYTDTVASSGNGAGGMLTSLLAGGAGAFAGKAFSGMKNFFGKGGKGAGATNFFKGLGSKAMKFGGRALSGAAVYGSMEWLQKQLNRADVPDWLRTAGNVAFDTGQGALTGLAVGKNPFAALAGAGAGFAGSLANPYGEEGDGSDGADPSRVNPLDGGLVVTSPFGVTRHITFSDGSKSPTYGKAHGGVDLRAAEGTNVFAVSDGTVEGTPYDGGGFGNYIKTLNPDGTEHFYGHLDKKLVPAGKAVKAGELIGQSGKSGGGPGMGPHLHFEVRKGGNKLDPMQYLANAADAGNNAVPPAKSSLTIKKGAGDLILQPMGGEGHVSPVGFGRGATHQDTAQTINYGGVTINFHMPEKSANDVKLIAAEVKRVLSDSSIREKAMMK
jgi:murein DD-endopeptidase MepM/ murein hydrolase activator NlpD